jgi:hypothetical protein
MDPIGSHVTIGIGPTLPVPMPQPLTDAFQQATISHTDDGHSGFQITFGSGREGIAGLIDSPILSSQLLRPFNRVLIVLTTGPFPTVLMDGVITHQQVNPSNEAGASTVSITGEDMSALMDLHEMSSELVGQEDSVAAALIIAQYATYGVVPAVLPPPVIDPPLPIDRTPVQLETDLGHLRTMAQRYGYVFFVAPGPAPGMSTGYWGPPQRIGVPQRALSVGMGSHSNVDSLNFQNDARAPAIVEGEVVDPNLGSSLPVMTFASTRPPLAAEPAILVNQPHVRRLQFRESGYAYPQAMARAQGTTDASTDVVTATGEIDGNRYGGALQARSIVGVRGAGFENDGFYYVKQVEHTVKRGSYRQSFTLTREGTGSITPVVVP